MWLCSFTNNWMYWWLIWCINCVKWFTALMCGTAEYSKLHSELAAAGCGRCAYRDCGKTLEKSSLKCCERCNASYCSSNCRQSDSFLHQNVCQLASAREEKLEDDFRSTVTLGDTCAYCGKTSDTVKKCSRCKKVSYCSKSCQQADWSKHKTGCRSEQSRDNPEASSQDDGTREQAVVKRECGYCGKVSESLKHCAQCTEVSYCDRNCQQADWPRHKRVCKELERIGKTWKNLEELKHLEAVVDSCHYCAKTSDTLKKCTLCRKVSYCDRKCQQADWSRHKAVCTAWKTFCVTAHGGIGKTASREVYRPDGNNQLTLDSENFSIFRYVSGSERCDFLWFITVCAHRQHTVTLLRCYTKVFSTVLYCVSPDYTDYSVHSLCLASTWILHWWSPYL